MDTSSDKQNLTRENLDMVKKAKFDSFEILPISYSFTNPIEYIYIYIYIYK